MMFPLQRPGLETLHLIAEREVYCTTALFKSPFSLMVLFCLKVKWSSAMLACASFRHLCPLTNLKWNTTSHVYFQRCIHWSGAACMILDGFDRLNLWNQYRLTYVAALQRPPTNSVLIKTFLAILWFMSCFQAFSCFVFSYLGRSDLKHYVVYCLDGRWTHQGAILQKQVTGLTG